MPSVSGPSSIATASEYTGLGSLGSSIFSLEAETAPLEAGLGRAEKAAKDVSQKIGQYLGRGGNAAQGFLYLGQAVDDLQYGFRAIVNNIPMLVTALGGGGGPVLAVSVRSPDKPLGKLEELC
jgi:hypothetical protein